MNFFFLSFSLSLSLLKATKNGRGGFYGISMLCAGVFFGEV